jgi:hypothetical protein
MSYGNWISQSHVRKAAKPGGGGGDATHGYEISTLNIEGALDVLGLAHDAWDWKTQPQPQTQAYLKWLKGHLVKREPVVWMIMCQGDSHTALNQGWDHIEPVWGLYSNHSLDDPTPYPTDVVVHGSDYGAKGSVEAPSLYRTLASLPDDQRMQGNCAGAQPQHGRNEFYPCLPDTQDFGFAILGNAEEVAAAAARRQRGGGGGGGSGGGSVLTVPLSLAVDQFDEPDLRRFQRPSQLRATVTVGAGTHANATLVPGAQYVLYRWDDYRLVPDSPDKYAGSNFTAEHPFSSSAATYVYNDPATILSSGTTYYRCAARGAAA